jgi:inhibitor of growth protein 3
VRAGPWLFSRTPAEQSAGRLATLARETRLYRDARLAPASESKETRLARLRAVALAAGEAQRASEEKVGLAVTAYASVDAHIRRLDADLQRSESSLLLGLRAGTEASRGVREALGMASPEEEARRADDTPQSSALELEAPEAETSPQPAAQARGRSRARGGRGGRGAGRGWRGGMRGSWREWKGDGAAPDAAPDGGDGDDEAARGLVPDMPIDPNEPKYCYCDRVSFGDVSAAAVLLASPR